MEELQTRLTALESDVSAIKVHVGTVADAITKLETSMEKFGAVVERQGQSMELLGQKIATWIETQRDYIPLSTFMRLTGYICAVVSATLAVLFGIKAAFGL